MGFQFETCVLQNCMLKIQRLIGKTKLGQTTTNSRLGLEAYLR
jgi:hypothetical protein